VLLRDTPLVLVVCAFLLAPGVLWALLAYPSPRRTIRVGVGLALGIAIQVTLAAPLAATVGISATSELVATFLVLTGAATLGWAMRVRTPRLPALAPWRRRETAWLAMVIVVGVAVCAAPLALWSVPDGWDPSAHVLLASNIIATGRLPTWKPFEPIASNYPYGAHALIADISLLTGIAPDRVFGVLLSMIAPALAMLLVYALARRMWRRGDFAVAAAAAFGLLGFGCSVAYGSWGGLPNALGLILLLAALEPLFAPGYTRRRIMVAGFLLSATTLTHHHVTLTVALLFGAFSIALAALLTVRWTRGETAPLPALQRQLMRTLAVCGLGLLLAGYQFAPYLIRNAQALNSTDVFLDYHEYSGWPFDKNGILLWICAALGVALSLNSVWRRAKREAGIRERLGQTIGRLAVPSAASQARLFAAIALAILFAVFVFGQFIYKDIEWTLYHRDRTAFNPSRFLTDMTYFLAVYAAPALVWLWNAGRRLAGERWAAAQRVLVLGSRGALAACPVIVAIVSLFASGQLSPGAGQLHAGNRAAFAWVRAHTAANTLVISLTPNDDKWAPYFTKREAYYTPLPASEDASGYVTEKRDIIGAELAALNTTPRLRLVALGSAGSAWPALANRPVAVIVDHPMPALGASVFTSDGAFVYLIASLETLVPGSGTPPTVSLSWGMQATILRAGANALVEGAGKWTPGHSYIVGPRGARWLVMHLSRPLAPGAAVVCHAQDGAQLWVDGTYQPRACYGAITALPVLAATGPHTISVFIWRGADAMPWIDIVVLERATGV
jgi:hypothetical protein